MQRRFKRIGKLTAENIKKIQIQRMKANIGKWHKERRDERTDLFQGQRGDSTKPGAWRSPWNLGFAITMNYHRSGQRKWALLSWWTYVLVIVQQAGGGLLYLVIVIRDCGCLYHHYDDKNENSQKFYHSFGIIIITIQ